MEGLNPNSTEQRSQIESTSLDPEAPAKDNQMSKDIGMETQFQDQAECLKKLITEDAPIIAQLVSGKRRKSDGSFFYVGGFNLYFELDFCYSTLRQKKLINGCSSLVVMCMPSLKLVYQRIERLPAKKPNIPKIIDFHEVSPLVTLFEHLKKTAPQFIPDIVMVYGDGTFHPKGFDMASQLGLILDVPTIGVERYFRSGHGFENDKEHHKKYNQTRLKQSLKVAEKSGYLWQMAVMGDFWCVLAHDKAQDPIYISIGHKISLPSAEWIVLETTTERVPKPLERAGLDAMVYLDQDKKSPQEFVLMDT